MNLDNKINPLAEDLNHILTYTKDLWEEFRDQKIFITGGTGFFGCWLLESFAWANDKLNLNALAVVLSRNPACFENRVPHLYHHNAIQFLKGDVKDFIFPEGVFSHIVHCAVYQTPAGEKVSNILMLNEMIVGLKRVLDFCIKAKAKKMLLISTGAVYGKNPSFRGQISENCCYAPDPTASESTYHQVRRIIESMSMAYAEENAFDAKIARCFSFLGPYMPLNGRFAVSDFIHDVLSNTNILVKGDGKTVRSYLYMADLIIWLWTILIKGKASRPYNVGSEIPVTIKELAHIFSRIADPHLEIIISGQSNHGIAADYYIPDTTRAQRELNLQQLINLNDAVEKTIHWYERHVSGKEYCNG